MRTYEEAKLEASKFIGRYDIPPVVTEHKHSARGKTWFGFRFFGNEEFSTEWKKDRYGDYSRMVEVLA